VSILSLKTIFSNDYGQAISNQKIESYPLFDWLRFILASIVVLDHAGYQFAPFLTGPLAVCVFFALSGWLIGGILLRTEISELPRFFFNRSTRIWIPYFAAIILLYGIAVLREGVDFFWLKYLVMDITFTHQLFTFLPVAKYEMPLDGSGNQFWSISVEEQFYLLAPLIMLFISMGKKLILWVVISVLLLLAGSWFGVISLGVCMAVIQRDYKIADQLWCRLVALFLILISGVILSMNIDSLKILTKGIFSAGVVLFLAIPGKRSKMALFLGGLSFPLYLNHWLGLTFVNGFAKQLGLSEFIFLPLVSYLCAVVITIPLYLMLDRPVSKYRNKWYTHRLGRNLGFFSYFLVVLGIILGTLMYQYGPHGVVPLNGS